MIITKENISSEAKLGNLDVLSHPLCAIISKKDSGVGAISIYWTPLHRLAYLGLKEVLRHPSVGIVVDNSLDYYTPLHILALRGVDEVMSLEGAYLAKNPKGITPLHLLAERGNLSVLKHEHVSRVKTNKGNTPLHALAELGITEVLKHDDVDRVTNKVGNTPLHQLANNLHNHYSHFFIKV